MPYPYTFPVQLNMKFSEIENLTMLGEFLCVSKVNLSTLLSNDDSATFCTKMAIPKKNTHLGFRIVYKVNNQILRNIHKVLQMHLNEMYFAPASVHGFVTDRNTRTNAQRHLAKKKILKLDIEDFFNSISDSDIARVLERIGCRSDVASWLAQLTTIEGKLVQGFNTSPVLANMAFIDMDNLLESLSRKYQSEFTRYADDITISSDGELPSIAEVESILVNTQFRINKSKTKIMFRGENQFVTGLSVFDNKYPRVPKQFKRRIRLQLYYLNKYGGKSYVMRETGISEIEAETDYTKAEILHKRLIRVQYEIKGWIDYVNSIEPSLACRYYDIFNEIKW